MQQVVHAALGEPEPHVLTGQPEHVASGASLAAGVAAAVPRRPAMTTREKKRMVQRGSGGELSVQSQGG
jgi:hypothetical protein